MSTSRRASETTPLLPSSVTSRFSFNRRRPSLAITENEDSDEDGGVDDLSLNLARVGSISSGTGIDPGRPYYAGSTPKRMSTVERADWNIEEALDSHSVIEDEEPEDPRFINITPKRFWATFAILMLVFFVACFDSTLMASSHPVITSYFEASQAAPWLSTVFLISSTAFQPLFGRLSDMVGRKSIFTVTVGFFALTTLWCGLATSIESFIAARAVCGLGAGGAMAMCLIIVSDLVRIEHRGVFQSHINVAYGTGAAAGAAFGGFLCDRLGWRWAFGIQVPFIGVCFILAFILIPADLGPMLIKREGGSPWEALRSFDSRGSMLLVLTVTTLILALNLGGNIYPWLSPIIIVCAVIFVISGMLFLWRETKAKHPLMPLTLLSTTPIANLIFSNFFGSIANNTLFFNVPLFFQAVLLTSAADSGFRMALPVLAGSSIGVSVGYIITYTKRLKPTITVGSLLYIFGSVAILFMNRHVSDALSLVLIIGVSMGQGFVFPTTMMSVLAISKQEDQAVVTTTLGLWRNLGVVMGVALSSLVFQNSLLINLNKLVTEPDKKNVIEKVRTSVRSIKFLDTMHQNQGE